MLGWRIEKFAEFRETLKAQAPEYIFDLWLEGRDEITLIIEKYELTEWQRMAYGAIQGEIFLREIRLITLPNEIKKRLKIKDQNIANSIALDTAMHVLSKAEDYFIGTDNLIKSLGGEDAYWEKYSPDYWSEIETAEPLITTRDMENARNATKKEISKAEDALKKIEDGSSKFVAIESYSQAHSIFNKATNNLKSEDYDLICESEWLAKDVIDALNEAEEVVLKYEKNERRSRAKENNMSRIKDEITKLGKMNKTLTQSVFIGVAFLFLAFALGSIWCYFFFAIIMGINMYYSDYGTYEHNWTSAVVGFPMGFVVAPLLILNWGAKDSRDRIIQDKYIECNKLKNSI